MHHHYSVQSITGFSQSTAYGEPCIDLNKSRAQSRRAGELSEVHRKLGEAQAKSAQLQSSLDAAVVFALNLFFLFITLGLEMSDTQVYEP